MQINIHSEIKQIAVDDWNNLVRDDNPFLQHEFLAALENNHCVSDQFGWHPCHIAIRKNEKLIAAMPLYSKMNSYGEFVFDHAWADAYQRNQLAYYPKLVSAIPYTPASGQRLLAPEENQNELFQLLIDTVKQLSKQQSFSGFHCLFPLEKELEWMKKQNFLIRHDCQFHWNNQDYTSFEDFLETLEKKKRKNIRQERKRVDQQKVSLRILNGHTATNKDWDDFTLFYEQTFSEKYGTATLNQGFFKEVAKNLPDQIILVLADKPDGQCIAGSLMYASNTTLYGRHWGCTEQIDKLHFEACYYQGIEYCIKHKLKVFEPGAQGEHKIARGFIPTLTRSAHWLNQSPFDESIRAFIKHEKSAVKQYMSSLKSPYKKVGSKIK